jgi:hypothetical protein
MMFAIMRQNKMVGIAQKFEYIMRDESLHLDESVYRSKLRINIFLKRGSPNTGMAAPGLGARDLSEPAALREKKKYGQVKK